MPTYSGTPVTASQDIGDYQFTNEDALARLYSQVGLDAVFSAFDETEEDNYLNDKACDAEQTIIIRLSRFFTPEEMANSKWIQSRATWILAYLVSHKDGQEHYFSSLYEMAMRELDAMATGEIPPDINIPLRDSSYPSMSNMTMDEKFGGQRLRVHKTISVGGSYADQHFVFGHLYSGWF
jgi:glycerophosphoryl diester phosphodiesterase